MGTIINISDYKNRSISDNKQMSTIHLETLNEYYKDLCSAIATLLESQNKISELENKRFAFFKKRKLKRLYAFEMKNRIVVLTFYYLFDKKYTSYEEAMKHAEQDVYRGYNKFNFVMFDDKNLEALNHEL